MDNPLIEAVEAYEHHMDTMAMIEVAITGEVEEYDEKLYDAVINLVMDASTAVQDLAPRGRIARLNALWKAFQEEQAKTRGDNR